jgi:hypothetical protein
MVNPHALDISERPMRSRVAIARGVMEIAMSRARLIPTVLMSALVLSTNALAQGGGSGGAGGAGAGAAGGGRAANGGSGSSGTSSGTASQGSSTTTGSGANVRQPEFQSADEHSEESKQFQQSEPKPKSVTAVPVRRRA